MKIEYFADGCDGCPLILIYGNDPVGALNLRLAVERLAIGLVDGLAIHEFPGYSSVNNCRLFIKGGRSDIGVRHLEQENTFECTLRKDTWLDIIGLLEPFTESDRKDEGYLFQYLNESGEIGLLISTERAW